MMIKDQTIIRIHVNDKNNKYKVSYDNNLQRIRWLLKDQNIEQKMKKTDMKTYW